MLLFSLHLVMLAISIKLIFYHFIQKYYKKVISVPFSVILVINRLFRLIRVILVFRIIEEIPKESLKQWTYKQTNKQTYDYKLKKNPRNVIDDFGT
jgi:hypothetical protein